MEKVKFLVKFDKSLDNLEIEWKKKNVGLILVNTWGIIYKSYMDFGMKWNSNSWIGIKLISFNCFFSPFSDG